MWKGGNASVRGRRILGVPPFPYPNFALLRLLVGLPKFIT